jgi:hypothetical protein
MESTSVDATPVEPTTPSTVAKETQ